MACIRVVVPMKYNKNEAMSTCTSKFERASGLLMNVKRMFAALLINLNLTITMNKNVTKGNYSLGLRLAEVGKSAYELALFQMSLNVLP